MHLARYLARHRLVVVMKRLTLPLCLKNQFFSTGKGSVKATHRSRDYTRFRDRLKINKQGGANNFQGSKYSRKQHVFTKISIFEISNPKN